MYFLNLIGSSVRDEEIIKLIHTRYFFPFFKRWRTTFGCCLFLFWLVTCIIIFLSREEAPRVLIILCWTINLHQLRKFLVPRFRLLLEILSTLIYCLILFVFHQAHTNIVKRFIQGRCNVTRARAEAETSPSWSPWKRRF